MSNIGNHFFGESISSLGVQCSHDNHNKRIHLPSAFLIKNHHAITSCPIQAFAIVCTILLKSAPWWRRDMLLIPWESKRNNILPQSRRLRPALWIPTIQSWSKFIYPPQLAIAMWLAWKKDGNCITAFAAWPFCEASMSGLPRHWRWAESRADNLIH